MIDHLVILVSPHIIREGRRPGIEGRFFQPLRPNAVAGRGIAPFTGVHQFRHGAQFCPLRVACTGEALVPGECTYRSTVPLLQLSPKSLADVRGLFAEEGITQRLVFQHHTQIDNVRLLPPLVHGAFPQRCEGCIVRPLLPQHTAQGLHPRFGLALVQVQQRNQPLKPAELSPIKQMYLACRHQVMQVLHRCVEGVFSPLVTRKFTVQRQHLSNQQHRPQIVGRARRWITRADPAIRLLAIDDALHIAIRPSDQIFILQKMGQRDKAVQPVGHAFPALTISANPRAVTHVRPDFVQIAGQSPGLDLQLAAQPALRLDSTIKELIHIVYPSQTSTYSKPRPSVLALMPTRPAVRGMGSVYSSSSPFSPSTVIRLPLTRKVSFS